MATTTTTRSIVTLPRLAVLAVILCLLFQLYRGKSTELPKYTAPEYVETSLLERVNNHRVSIRLQPLQIDTQLDREAQRYCEMAAKGNLQASAGAFTVSNNDIAAWDNVKGIRRNVAVIEGDGKSPALSTIRKWIANESDVANLEHADLTTTGIGIVRRGNTYYICQIFASGATQQKTSGAKKAKS
jgi:hypothetical protein